MPPDLAGERRELASDPEHERTELAGIYEARGLTSDLADQVAGLLMAHNALSAHSRDELEISGNDPNPASSSRSGLRTGIFSRFHSFFWSGLFR
jgi:VIT1/CCC1 family predicted Fe2+/Mn2+ transporter